MRTLWLGGSPAHRRAARTWTLALACALIAACGGGGDGNAGAAKSMASTTYTVGGTVSGLSGSGLVLKDQSNTLAIAGNGAFTLPSTFASGASYEITVATQPLTPAQLCTVSNGSGVIGTANIDSIAVQCVTTISSKNASAVASLGSSSLEALLRLASFLGERLNYLSSHLAPAVSEPCTNAGTVTTGTASYSFADLDGSGTLSAGDTVALVLDECMSTSLGDHLTGSMTLTMLPAPQPVDYQTGYAASVMVTTLPLLNVTLSGPVNVTYVDSYTRRLVAASVGSQPMSISYTVNSFNRDDTIQLREASASKLIDYSVPQYVIHFSGNYHSDLLKGDFSIDTTTPLTGQPGYYPTAGMEEFHGGVTTLRLAAQDVASNDMAQASLDADGSGSFQPLDPYAFSWQQEVGGFVWWEPHSWFSFASAFPMYPAQVKQFWMMYLYFATPMQDPVNYVIGDGIDVDTTVRLYFSGPFDASRSLLQYFQNGPPSVGSPARTAKISVNGAIVTVTAQPQLEHGFEYYLGSTDYVYSTWAGAFGVLNSMRFTTNNNLQADAAPSPAVAASGQTVHLLSTHSYSTDSHIASYSWKQVSGPGVQLAGSNSAAASFVMPAEVADEERFVFQLTVTDANGETDSAPVTAFSLNDPTQSYLYYRRAQGPAAGLAPEMATLETPVLGSIRTELFQVPNQFKFILTGTAFSDMLEFDSPYGSDMSVGTYTNISPPGSRGISVQSWPFECNTPDWQFTILSLAGAPDGTASNFAADFSRACPGGQPPLVGSVRVNSDIPLP